MGEGWGHSSGELRPREGQAADRGPGDGAFRVQLEMSSIRPAERLNREEKERKTWGEMIALRFQTQAKGRNG